MKKIFTLAAIMAVVAFSSVHAASLSVESAGDVHSIFLNGEADNGNFDTIIVSITPDAGSEIANPNPAGVDGFTPLAPGDTDNSFVNALLSAPPAFGGNGFSILGQVVQSDGIEFTGGPLGMTIDTENGPNVGPNGLFLANVILPNMGTGSASVSLVRGGSVVSELTTLLPVPEPTTMALAGLSLVALACGRRK